MVGAAGGINWRSRSSSLQPEAQPRAGLGEVRGLLIGRSAGEQPVRHRPIQQPSIVKGEFIQQLVVFGGHAFAVSYSGDRGIGDRVRGALGPGHLRYPAQQDTCLVRPVGASDQGAIRA